MKFFKYRAKNFENEVIIDIIEADDKADAIRKLKNNLLIPLELKEIKVNRISKFLQMTVTSGVSKRDLVFFLSQLYNLLNAGLGIIDSLKIIIDQTTNKYLRGYVANMLQDIRNGSSLYEAMKNCGKAFPRLMVEMVRVGEAIGNLKEIVHDLYRYYEKQLKNESDIKAALTYPIIIFVSTILVAIFLLTSVIPIIQASLEALGQELPLPTRIVIGVSNFLIDHGMVLMIAVILLMILLSLYHRTPKGKRVFSTLAIHLPIFGPLIRKSNLVRLSSTLSTLLRNRVNAIKALEITSNVIGNVRYKEIIDRSQTYLENGIPISKAFEKEKIIDPVFVSMMRIGEEAATLDEMLGNLATYYDTEMDMTIAQFKKLIEPIMTVFLVIIVGTILLAILLPQFIQLQIQ